MEGWIGRIRLWLRRYFVPLLFLTLVIGAAWIFRAVLLPFLVAIFVVFLIEPLVKRLTMIPLGGRRIPRVGAVAIVYALIIGSVTTFTLLFVPRLGVEMSNLGREAPRMVQELREEKLPEVSRRLERMMFNVMPDRVLDRSVRHARHGVAEATRQAGAGAVLVAGLPPEDRAALDAGRVELRVAPSEDDEPRAVLTLRPRSDGSLDVELGDAPLLLEPWDGTSWRLRTAPRAADDGDVPLDLTRQLDQMLQGVIESSGDQIGGLLSLGQRLISGVLRMIVSITIILMVAAFVSIDVPRIVGFFRDLFPPDTHDTVSDLLTKLDGGLAGVIRGQFMICLVNGFLTGVGLVLLDVKFALSLALIAGVLSLIPIFGTIISTIPAVAVGLTSSFMTGVLVLGWILLIHFIEANMLNPKIIGTTARIHPAVVVFSLIAGEHTFGLIGALLAVPAASIVQTLFLFVRDMTAPSASVDSSGGNHENPVQHEDGRRSEAGA